MCERVPSRALLFALIAVVAYAGGPVLAADSDTAAGGGTKSLLALRS